MKRALKLNIFISITSMFIILAIAEVSMRFFWEMGGWVKRPIYQRSGNPYLRYELVPNVKDGNFVSLNSDGFRGPEYSLPKSASTFRIIMLGDSETLSLKLPPQPYLSQSVRKSIEPFSSPATL